MTQSILAKTEAKAFSPSGSTRFLGGVAAVCLYLAFWGCLGAMAGLSLGELWPLIPGLCLGAALSLLPKKERLGRVVLLSVLVLSALVCLLRLTVFLDGIKYFLNLLFAQSEARQSYTYERFAVGEAVASLRYALFPLGLLFGIFCSGGRALLPFLSLCAAGAWLGVSPPLFSLLLLIPALGLSCLLPRSADLSPRSLLAAALALGAVCAAVVLLLPGEDLALSAWEEEARDRLAGTRVAYVETAAPEPTPEPPPRESAPPPLYETEDAPGDVGGNQLTWTRPMSALAVILFFALLLFLPALFSDWTKKRREKNRAWETGADLSAAVRDGFRHALRWLELGGLKPENRLYSACVEPVRDLFSPDLAKAIEDALPLWQEAAYSDHAVTEDQRQQMVLFAQQVRDTVWPRLSKRERLLVKYVYAL